MGASCRILGIDPGLQKTGWGVIDAEGNHRRFVACGTITTKQKTLVDRLKELHDGLKTVLETYLPHQAAIEETFINTNARSSLKLGHARGALMLTVSLSAIPLEEYAATLVKKSIVGVGRAEKEQVGMMVKQLLPGCKPDSADAADALAVAICHANHAWTKKLVVT